MGAGMQRATAHLILGHIIILWTATDEGLWMCAR